MSAAMVKAHGGSRTITDNEGVLRNSGIIQNTKANVAGSVHMKQLSRLISQTTGIPREKPVMEGVLTRTVTGQPDTPEFHKVPKGEVGKTKTKRMGQVAYQGPKY